MDATLREFVRQRAADRCEYCRLPQTAARFLRFHIEHIRARQHGGSDNDSNLALACPDCNAFKGPNLTTIDPDTDQIVEIFNPRESSWEDHFSLSGEEIVGVSPVGPGTVRLLDMNAEDRRIIRACLIERDEF